MPSWLEIQIPASMPESELASAELDIGEHEALLLALDQTNPVLFLSDDNKARRTADALGFQNFGTLGVLLEAARQDLVDLPRVVERLLQTNFHYHQRVIDELLRKHQAWKQS